MLTPTQQTLSIRLPSFLLFPAFFTLNGTTDFLHLLSLSHPHIHTYLPYITVMLRLRHSCAWFDLHSDCLFHQPNHHPSTPHPTSITFTFLHFQSKALTNSSPLYLSLCFRLNCSCPCLWTSGSCILLPLDTPASRSYEKKRERKTGGRHNLHISRFNIRTRPDQARPGDIFLQFPALT